MRYTALWQYDCVKCFKNMRIHQNQKTRSLISKNFENFEQFDSKLESNWHWPKMRKNGHFLIKNEFQRPRFGGGLFGHKKHVTFAVGDRFSSMEIVSEPATPALKRRLRRNESYCAENLGFQHSIWSWKLELRKHDSNAKRFRFTIWQLLVKRLLRHN